MPELTDRPWARFVVHKARAKYDVLVDRSTMWGNPFPVSRDVSRPESVRLFRKWAAESDDPRAAAVRARLPELRGKVLACWCSPLLCHGEVLAELANARK